MHALLGQARVRTARAGRCLQRQIRAFSTEHMTLPDLFPNLSDDPQHAWFVWKTNACRLPCSTSLATAAFDLQMNHEASRGEWAHLSQYMMVLFWAELLRTQPDGDSAMTLFRHMLEGSQAASYTQEEKEAGLPLEIASGVLKAFLLSMPAEFNRVRAGQALAKRAVDEGLYPAFLQEATAAGLHHEAAQAHADWRAGSILALPHWLLHADGAQASPSSPLDEAGFPARARLYLEPATWPNPGLPAAQGIWRSSALSGVTPWWAVSSELASSCAELTGFKAEQSTDYFQAEVGAQLVTCRAMTQGYLHGFFASGRPEYVSTLTELASHWMHFSEDFPLDYVQDLAFEDPADPLSDEFGEPLPASIAGVPTTAPQWAGSRMALHWLSIIVTEYACAWDAFVQQTEVVMEAALQAQDGGSADSRQRSTDALAAMQEGHAAPHLDLSGLPPHMQQVVLFTMTYMPVFARQRATVHAAALETLETELPPATRAIMQDAAKDPVRMHSVEGAGTPKFPAASR